MLACAELFVVQDFANHEYLMGVHVRACLCLEGQTVVAEQSGRVWGDDSSNFNAVKNYVKTRFVSPGGERSGCRISKEV